VNAGGNIFDLPEPLPSGKLTVWENHPFLMGNLQ
jgi:hypothetical protein